ncbi:MAG: ribosomal protein S18-alanine N-acetyltransferase [bacterium]
MEIEDLDRVVELENTCFDQPWSEQMFYKDLVDNSNSRFYVAEREGDVVGYIGIWVVVDCVHVTTVGVDPSLRREGIGSLLIQHVLDQFEGEPRDITLEVRESNKAARGLYEKNGFEVTGRRTNYYSNNGEDALIMHYGTSGTPVADSSLGDHEPT